MEGMNIRQPNNVVELNSHALEKKRRGRPRKAVSPQANPPEPYTLTAADEDRIKYHVARKEHAAKMRVKERLVPINSPEQAEWAQRRAAAALEAEKLKAEGSLPVETVSLEAEKPADLAAIAAEYLQVHEPQPEAPRIHAEAEVLPDNVVVLHPAQTETPPTIVEPEKPAGIQHGAIDKFLTNWFGWK